MRILLAGASYRLVNLLNEHLNDRSYLIDHATDGQDAETMAYDNQYDLLVMSSLLPSKGTLTVLKSLRTKGIETPVLIIMGNDSKEELIEFLNAGIDDYVTEHYTIGELLLRIEALLAGSRYRNQSNRWTVAGPIKIDSSRREVTFEGYPVDLTVKEYFLLLYLVKHEGSVVTRTDIAENVWSETFELSSNIVDVYVGYLRSKIDKAFGANLIKTVRGHGYMFDTRGYKKRDNIQPFLPEVMKNSSEPVGAAVS